MSEPGATADRRISRDLGDLSPARSRHGGRRSVVHATEDGVLVGTAHGGLRVFSTADDDLGTERWRVDGTDDGAAVVTAASLGDRLVVGERGPAGRIRGYDLATGERRFAYETAADVGRSSRESRFYRPYVVALTTTDDRIYAAARRYERDGGDRAFESTVYALAPDGTIRWQYAAPASPISLDADGDRLAVAYNRRPEGGPGLVVLDPETGDERWSWDPPGDGRRRVGDVALLPDGLAVTSHADYRGYRLDADGVRWRADLATPTEAGDETLYAYPNHVHAVGDGLVFVTGSTYPEEGRETDGLHPDEHVAFAYGRDGDRRGRVDLDGFAGDLAAGNDELFLAVGQNFRTRDADAHAVLGVDASGTRTARRDVAGVATAVAADVDGVAAVEEPVAYHDEDATRGAYRLHRFPR